MSGSLGEASATNEFGSEYVDGLYGYAMVLTRNHAEAEDLVQETYVRALGAAGRLRENSNVKGWLFTILRNLWFNELRKRRNVPAILEMDGDDYTADSLVADVLGCPAGTVMSRLGRARAKLRTALADTWSTPGRSERRNQS